MITEICSWLPFFRKQAEFLVYATGIAAENILQFSLITNYVLFGVCISRTSGVKQQCCNDEQWYEEFPPNAANYWRHLRHQSSATWSIRRLPVTACLLPQLAIYACNSHGRTCAQSAAVRSTVTGRAALSIDQGRRQRLLHRSRGVATAGTRGCALLCPPYIKMTTDSLSSELTFDEWHGVILQRIIRPTLLLHVINHYTTCCF